MTLYFESDDEIDVDVLRFIGNRIRKYKVYKEAHSHGKSVLEYKKKSTAADDINKFLNRLNLPIKTK